MSFMFSKNREKRSRTSTGESNSSFVRNVTSRVSGLLPAGIAKWFSSPSSSSGNGSAAIADGTDSSSDDDAPESPITVPPAKRFRYNSPDGKYPLLTTSETTTTSNVVTETASVLYSSIQSTPGRYPYGRDPNSVSTPIRSPIHNPEHSMSANTFTERTERDIYKEYTVSAIGQSIAKKRISLLDSDRQKEQTLSACAKTGAHHVGDYKQPYLKPHLMGSPFYPGKTMYGGASASHTPPYTSSCYVTHPNIMLRKPYVNESKDPEEVNMSTSSRQIMDLLENYSSPLIEAKRIPRYELTELRDINSTMHSMPNTSLNTMTSFNRQDLHMPTKASLIRMKARNRLMNSTKAARQIIASRSSSLPYYQQTYAPAAPASAPTHVIPELDSGQSNCQSKLKSRLTRTHCGGDPFEMPDAVELPTAILRIDQNNLPTFSFGSNVSEPNFGTFKFSSPVSATSDIQDAGTSPTAFDFGCPRRAAVDTSPTTYSYGNQIRLEMTKPLLENQGASDTQSTMKTVIAFAKASNDWKCSDCLVSNKVNAQKCICCGSKHPSKEINTSSATRSKCTTCKHADSLPNSDNCVNCDKFRACLKTSHPLAVTKNSSTKWKCGDCWVDNYENCEKCVCCGSRNPQKTSTGNAQAAALVPADNAAAPIERDWTCIICMITNKPSIIKCAACGGAKPGVTKPLPSVTTSNFPSITDDKFAEIVKSQKSSWECRVCLTRNENEITVCSCCETVKHGASNNAPKLNNFKFNIEANTGFKFGIDPKTQEMNLAKKVDVVPVPMKPEESETNNNIVPKMPSFSLPTKKPEDVVDIPKTNEVPKPSFSFGIPAQSASLAVTKHPDTKLADDKEKPQEVPSISFKTSEAKQTLGWSPTVSATSNPANAMNAFLNNSSENNITILTNKSTPTTMEDSKPQFSFSTGAVTQSTGGLFSSQAKPSVSSSLTQAANTTALFAEPTASPAVSFLKSDTTGATPATHSTLFQSTQRKAATTVSAAAPMFSFGTSQSANPAPATEAKPNFSFSSSTTPAFGATQQPTLSNGPSGMSNPQMTGNMNSGNVASNGNAQLTGGTSMFDTPAKAHSMWPSPAQMNQVHPFATGTPANPAFTFGATPVPSPFGASNAQPVTFSASQPAQAMFGMNQGGGSQPMFAAGAGAGAVAVSQPATPMFGAPSPSAGMFGESTAMASFDSPAPAFNFGTSQAPSAVFGFGQGQQPQQQMPSMQPGSFGFAAPSAGQMQFAIGSSPSQGAAPPRRIRKAVRRNR